MLRWLRLGTRNYWVRPGRTAACLLSVALGVATVVFVTAFYETARRVITDEVMVNWVGAAHLSIEPPGAHHGLMSAGLAADVAKLPQVRHVSPRLNRRAFRVLTLTEDQLTADADAFIDLIGIDPVEGAPFVPLPGLEGRMFGAGEGGVAIIEKETAATWGLDLGDRLLVQAAIRTEAVPLTIVGLYDSQRLAEFQKPTVYVDIGEAQRIVNQPGGATVIDIMLDDPSPENVRAVRQELEALLAARELPYSVESTEARQQLLDEAERLTQVLLALLAGITMLTAFFIILTTMSASLVERRSQLGVLRCVGTTRGQLSAMLLAELLPLGVAGTLVGVVLGIGLTRLVTQLPDIHIPHVYLSPWGLQLAVISGLLTTLACTGILIVQVCRASPLQVVTSDARPSRGWIVVASGAVGAALIGVFMLRRTLLKQDAWLSASTLFLDGVIFYGGYVLLVPLIVLLIGRPLARVVGPILGIRGQLAVDQLGRAPWRSAGVCWMLIVGLSMIVYLSVVLRGSLDAIWSFPAQLPEAFVWSPDPVDSAAIERMRRVAGVKDFTVVTDLRCKLAPVKSDASPIAGLLQGLLDQVLEPTFVAGEPDKLPQLLKLSFVEGTQEDAIARLRKGGQVLIPVQASKRHGLHLDDKVRVTIGRKSSEFIVGGVVQSPALDIAVTFFQADSYFQLAAASAMLGTRQDLQDRFGIDRVSMFLCDLERSDIPPPPAFGPVDYTDNRAVAVAILAWKDALPFERPRIEAVEAELRLWLGTGTTLSDQAAAQVRHFGLALRRVWWNYERRTSEDNWALLQERLILQAVAEAMERPEAVIGSVARLKAHLERDLQRSTTILSLIPSISLFVASIGIANLMMVSVHARTRQLAILRAVGALRSQILRLVLTEAITLGLIGSVMGVAMGMHQAYADGKLLQELIGVRIAFAVPLGTIGLAVGLTLGVCLLAGLGPARRAARNDIVGALQTT
jgi:putative ABC transport system permease protein